MFLKIIYNNNKMMILPIYDDNKCGLYFILCVL